MISKVLRFGIYAAMASTVVACSQVGEMTPNKAKYGPDEFSVVPAKPLQQPQSLTELPTPTPGGSNLTDQNPKAEAIAALGGRASAVSGGDGGIVTYASRYGIDPNIRAELYNADERRRKGRGKYERAYKRFALDAQAEWERLRALGITVPSAPEN